MISFQTSKLYKIDSLLLFFGWISIELPSERIELSTPGLRDQCSASELRRLAKDDFINFNFFQSKFVLYKMF